MMPWPLINGAQPARPGGIDQGGRHGAAIEGCIEAAIERAVLGDDAGRWSAGDQSLASDRCLAPARWEAGRGWITLDWFEERGTKPFAGQRAIVVDPGDRRQLGQVGCIRHHFRKRHSARKFCEEALFIPPSSPL